MKYKTGSFILVPNKAALMGLKPHTQAVFLWICGHANESGNCFPSHETLARESGMSKRQVATCMDQLIEHGLLEKRHRSDGSKKLTNIYQIKVIDARLDAGSAGGLGHNMPEGSAHPADRTKSSELNKKEDMSSHDDTPLSFSKKSIKSETYLKNEAALQLLLGGGEFKKAEYDFPESGPFDWRYVINHGIGLTPEKYMLALYWQEKFQYTKLREQFFDTDCFFESRDIADIAIKRDLKDARELTKGVPYERFSELIENAIERSYDEKKNEYAWHCKIGTLIKDIGSLDGAR